MQFGIGFRGVQGLLACLVLCSSLVEAAEWHKIWERPLPERKVAWESTPRMDHDSGYLTATGGGLAFVGCEHNGALLALDATTGEGCWRFYTAAPIRWAPVATDSHVYVGSDDGFLYCLNHAGALKWKLRGGPSERYVIGHERMMSAWPISTTPLLADGVLYFTAGYWPVDGIHVHAVKAATGERLWSNDAAEFRPTRRIELLDGKLQIDGDNSGAVLDAKTGNMLNEKRTKVPPPERPEVSGTSGNISGWAIDGDFLAVTTTSGVYGFSTKKPDGVTAHELGSGVGGTVITTGLERAEKLVALSTCRDGFCLVAGLEDGLLVEGLLKKSNLSVVAVDADGKKVARIRQRLDESGEFDTHRLTLLTGKPGEINLPPYFANLIVSETSDQLIEAASGSLRPYNGVRVSMSGDVTVRKSGPEGSADWTHEFRDAANSLASPDRLVKAPLGLLWYGGEAADARFYFDGNVDHQSGHGLNPQPVPAQIVEGRMILQGPGLLGAIDIYTGRVLWESPLPKMYTFGGGGGGLGIHSKKHPRPWEYGPAMEFDVKPTQRCRASGFDSVSMPDAIYIAAATKLLRFNPATGETLTEWNLPIGEPSEELCWGGVQVIGDLLIATAFRPQDIADAQAGHDGNGGDWAGDRMPMAYLLAVDRHTGELAWHRKAAWGFLNRSGVCAGNGKVFCVDLITETIRGKFEEAGRTPPQAPPMLYALDAKTGDVVWDYELDVYVQNIVYSADNDLLLAPCRNLKEWRDGKWADLAVDARRGKTGKNAAGRMRALRGRDGEVVWDVSEAPYHSPHIVLGDLIIDRRGHSYDLLTGERHLRVSPLTGQKETWSFRKGGCNHLVACENLVTWRTAYYDLAGQSGVKALTGMDAGCSPTLLPAGGVLNVSNFGTHHKRNRMTAMALVHRPDNVLWTAYSTSSEKLTAPSEPDWFQHVGFNFGAPGDHFSHDGTPWLQVNSRNRSNVTFQPKQVEWFVLGTSRNGSPIRSSGIIGATEISIPTTQWTKPPGDATKTWTVRLYFDTPASSATGSNVFEIALEGETVMESFDAAPIAGRTVNEVREYTGVKVQGTLDIKLTARQGKTLLSGVELIAE